MIIRDCFIQGTILLSPELYEGLGSGDIYVGIITERPEKESNSSRTDMQGVLPVFQVRLSQGRWEM